jgi:hypothetical protein
MSKCTDKRLGKLLHDYEMGWLSDAEHEQFELHLMECEDCFAQVQQFKPVAALLSEDEDVKASLSASVMAVEPETTWWSRLWELFWPRTHLLLRPAVVYLAIIILLPLAYRGVYHEAAPEPQDVRPVKAVSLVSTRAPRVTVRPEPGKDLILSFAYDGAVPGQEYTLTLISERRGPVYSDNRFIFDSRQAAYLIVPNDYLDEGEYLLVIEDPSDTSALGTDTLVFRVEY